MEHAFNEIWLAFHGNLLQNPRFIRIAGGVIPWRSEVRLVFNTNSVTDESYGPLFTLGLGWFGTEYDGFLTKIPCPPPEPVAMSNALTQYYQVFPTMFGVPTTELPMTEPNGRPNRNDKKVNKRFQDLAKSVDGGGNSCESLGIGGAESFLVYGSLVIQVISLAWTDPNFRNQLLNTTHPTVAPLLGGYFKFHNPWNFNLRFALDPSSPDYRSNNPEKAWGKYVKSIKNEIELNFPHPPTNTRLWPAAITSYNATGPAYPFSCI
jgi:ribosomally synthesized peptide (two-chain TOMM family)